METVNKETRAEENSGLLTEKEKNDIRNKLNSEEYTEFSKELAVNVPYTDASVKDAIDALRGLRDMVTQLSTVGSFIALVQVSLVTLTFENRDSGAQKATNVFFFASLLIGVIGTSVALAGASIYHMYITRLGRLLSKYKRMSNKIKWIRKNLEKPLNESVSKRIRNDVILLDEDKKTLEEEFPKHEQVLQIGVNTYSREDIEGSKIVSKYRTKLHLILSDAASTAAFCIVSGVICCLVGIYIFVVNTQPREVYIPVLVISVAGLNVCVGPWNGMFLSFCNEQAKRLKELKIKNASDLSSVLKSYKSPASDERTGNNDELIIVEIGRNKEA